ncbi:hypothetical protein [Egicoccus sp. AB-alg6-2]|uniref:hypothetical protein n=1 Tax=Egicoccus sp. AB-alg6-2 TaxID=3242692 RepID=UPI00359D4767
MGAGESGTSPVTAVFGVTIFLAFIMLATQTLTHLYATSVVTGVVFDAARRAASEHGGGCELAETHLRAGMGAHGAGATVHCLDDGDQLHLRVRTASPARLVEGVGGHIDRAAAVRIERGR